MVDKENIFQTQFAMVNQLIVLLVENLFCFLFSDSILNNLSCASKCNTRDSILA